MSKNRILSEIISKLLPNPDPDRILIPSTTSYTTQYNQKQKFELQSHTPKGDVDGATGCSLETRLVDQ